MFLRTLLSLACICQLCSCSGSSGSGRTDATEDSYNFASEGLVSVDTASGVLANDKGEQLIASLLSKPQIDEGFVFNSDGSFSYNAQSDEVLIDQFEYQVIGKDDVVENALVTITVYPKPVSTFDEYRVYVGQVNVVNNADGVLVNDQLNRTASSAILVREPSQAESFVLNADGSFSYTPKMTASGVDSFSYRVQDDVQSGDEQQVELVIDTGVFSANDDSFTIESGKILHLQPLQGLLKNDDGVRDATVLVQKLPSHAIDFNISAEGLLDYRTISETQSDDSFTYTLHKNNQTLGPFNVTIKIIQPTDVAVAPGFYDQCKQYQAGDIVDGVLSGTDVEGATFDLVTAPRYGALTSFDGGSGQYTYTRQSNNRGQDSFSYRIYDALGNYVADASQELIAIPYRVMPVGDSITSGVEFYDSAINTDTPASNIRVGYRKFLKDELTSHGYSIDLVGSRNEGYSVSGFADSQHNGVPGVSDEFVSNNIEQWLNTNSADIILMHIGTNATKNHLDHIKAIGSTIESWEKQEHNPVSWMLAKLIGRTDWTSSANAVIRFNGLIEGYVEDRSLAGDRIYLVDQYTALEAGRYLSADNLHPRAEGYRRMSLEWIKRLQETRAIAKCD